MFLHVCFSSRRGALNPTRAIWPHATLRGAHSNEAHEHCSDPISADPIYANETKKTSINKIKSCVKENKHEQTKINTKHCPFPRK